MREAKATPESEAKSTLPTTPRAQKNGRLKVVYHGTTGKFNVFKKGDVGFHFGTKSVKSSNPQWQKPKHQQMRLTLKSSLYRSK